MAFPRSRVTEDGQVPVPDEIRQKLGIRPGSVLEWHEEGDKVVVRPAQTYTSEDIHNALFKGKKPKRRTLKELKEGIGKYIDEQHARGRY